MALCPEASAVQNNRRMPVKCKILNTPNLSQELHVTDNKNDNKWCLPASLAFSLFTFLKSTVPLLLVRQSIKLNIKPGGNAKNVNVSKPDTALWRRGEQLQHPSQTADMQYGMSTCGPEERIGMAFQLKPDQV